MKKWKSFDFDSDEIETPEKKPKTSKRSNVKDKKTPIINLQKDFDFEKSLIPSAKDHLAVHAKKIEEVESWLKHFVLQKNQREHMSVLLLSGPTGSGKTTTLKVLCKDLNIQIQEWVNPNEIDFDDYRGAGQITKLIEFLGYSKYPSLLSTTSNGKKIVLIEDFPNAVIKNPPEFHNLLETYFFKLTTSVVFICTDANTRMLNISQTLFPQEIRMKYQIAHISFNPCPPTILKTAFKRIQNIMQQSTHILKFPNANTIEAIIASAMGDIRSAVYQFQFACLKGTSDLPVIKEIQAKQTGKRKRNQQTISKIKSMGRDEVLGLFHSVGRVMNVKRTETPDGWRLSCNLETLIDEFLIQPLSVLGFFQENYLKYYGDIDDCQKAADNLSQCQRLMQSWSDRHDTFTYAMWIAVMSLMVFNEHKVSGFTAITAPPKINKSPNEDITIRGLHITDNCYYNIITQTNRFHSFNE